MQDSLGEKERLLREQAAIVEEFKSQLAEKQCQAEQKPSTQKDLQGELNSYKQLWILREQQAATQSENIQNYENTVKKQSETLQLYSQKYKEVTKELNETKATFAAFKQSSEGEVKDQNAKILELNQSITELRLSKSQAEEEIAKNGQVIAEFRNQVESLLAKQVEMIGQKGKDQTLIADLQTTIIKLQEELKSASASVLPNQQQAAAAPSLPPPQEDSSMAFKALISDKLREFKSQRAKLATRMASESVMASEISQLKKQVAELNSVKYQRDSL